MKRVFTMALLALSFVALAQNEQGDTYTFDLEECIQYAVKNQVSVKNAVIDQVIAKNKVGEIRSAGLPQVSGLVAAQHNFPLRDLYLPPNSEFTNYTNPNVVHIQNIFQLPNTADASVNVSQLIFNSSYIVGLQVAKTYRELSVKQTQQNIIQLKGNVTKAYYLALVNLERANLFEVNITRVDSLLRQTKLLNKNGFVEKVDVDRIEVNLNNLITERQKFENLLTLSNIMLKYQMGLPLDKNLVLKGNIPDIKVDSTLIKAEKPNYSDRIEYSILETNRRLSEFDLKNNKWAYLPSLSASASFGLYRANNQFEFFNDAAMQWSKYAVIQGGLNIPIFDGFTKHYKIQQSKLNLIKLDNTKKNLEQTIEVQTASSQVNFKNSLYALEVQKRNMELARYVANVTRKKYQQGVGSNLEVVTAESSLKESQVNYYNALYDALVNKVDYDLAVGNIKN